jgi:hypothetical protein
MAGLVWNLLCNTRGKGARHGRPLCRRYPPSELAKLYRARWHAELDLSSLKQTMQMDVLRCKTPELVRKELWTHILAYNLIRTILAQAAQKHDLEPRSLSFKGAIQSLKAFQPVIALQGEQNTAHRRSLYHELLDAIAHSLRRRPTVSLRTPPQEEARQKLRLPAKTPRTDQTRNGPRVYRVLSAIRVSDRPC